MAPSIPPLLCLISLAGQNPGAEPAKRLSCPPSGTTTNKRENPASHDVAQDFLVEPVLVHMDTSDKDHYLVPTGARIGTAGE